MVERIAAYAASLDPITNGHINVVERTAPLYDKVIVIVASSNNKNYMFSTEERVEMAKVALKEFSNVEVISCVNRYVVSVATEHGAQVIIRGLRNFKDLEFEQILAEENRRVCPTLETVFIACRPDLAHVSSSLVKSHIGADPSWPEQIKHSVPTNVAREFVAKVTYNQARKHWEHLMNLVGNPLGSDVVFNDLVERYSEPHRHYHVLGHIVMMLDELQSFTKTRNSIRLLFAIWFHDTVYDPKSKTNEEDSAKLCDSAMEQLGVPNKHRERVHELILWTKHTINSSTYIGSLLIDLDLMILGRSEAEFGAYESGIRKEYKNVPLEIFNSKRADILQSFLDKKFVFNTEYFRQKYEEQAKRNLSNSIAILKQSPQ